MVGAGTSTPSTTPSAASTAPSSSTGVPDPTADAARDGANEDGGGRDAVGGTGAAGAASSGAGFRGFVLAGSFDKMLGSILPSSGADVLAKLQEKFPASDGFALGVLLEEEGLLYLDEPERLLKEHASIVALRGFTGDASKVHYLHIEGESHDLLDLVGVSGEERVRLVVAGSFREASSRSMSLREIYDEDQGGSLEGPVFVTTQGYAFGSTLKTLGKVAEATGVAVSVTRTIGALPFDVGVYDAAAFEGLPGANDLRSYHLTLVRFFADQNRELPDLSKYPYTLAAHDVILKGFLVPLPEDKAPAELDTLADRWLDTSGALKALSDAPGSPIGGFADSDLFSNFGKAEGRYHQARAVLVVTDVELAPATGSQRLRDLTVPAPVTHTQIQGFAAPMGAMSLLLDFSISGGQPKIYQMAALRGDISGPVTIDGLVISLAAQEAGIAAAGSAALSQNPWAEAIARDANNATWKSALASPSALIYPYKVTPASNWDAPLPMLMARVGDQLVWTPTIADRFARYELRQSAYVPASPADGTLVTTISDRAVTTHALSEDAKWYYTVWAFDDKGHSPSNPVYIQPAAAVVLTGVTHCSTNVRQCLQVSWSPYAGADFEKYEVFRRPSGSSAWTWTQGITQAGSTSVADNGLTCGTTYEYKVTLSAGGKTADSNLLPGTPSNGFGFCDQPTTSLTQVVFCSANQKTCLHAAWSAYNGQGFEKYELQRRVRTSDDWAVATTLTNVATTKYDDNGLTCGTAYDYRIVLYVAGGSAASNVLTGSPNNGFGGCF